MTPPSPGVLLCGPDDIVGRLIDACTGWRGWSHVAWATGRPDADGHELAIDVHHQRGIEWSTVRAVVRHRAWVRIPIADPTGAVERRLAARVGEPYSHVAMLTHPLRRVGVRAAGAYCSRVVYDALPPRLQRWLPEHPTPADFEVLR